MKIYDEKPYIDHELDEIRSVINLNVFNVFLFKLCGRDTCYYYICIFIQTILLNKDRSINRLPHYHRRK